MSDKLSTPVITKTLKQLQGVEHVLVHKTLYTSAFTVLVWIKGACIDSSVSSPACLDELADIVECHITDSLDNKKRTLNYRITH